MADHENQIFILEDDGYFREVLKGLCSEWGPTTAVSDMESALEAFTKRTFDLLLLDWHLILRDPSTFFATMDHFQANASRLALFTVPDLVQVVQAMKAGAVDVLWATQGKECLDGKIKEALSKEKSVPIAHAFVSRLAETLTEKAMAQKTSLFQARREFSKTFLQQVLSQQKLRRTQLADLMSVSPRTLHRHLSS